MRDLAEVFTTTIITLALIAVTYATVGSMLVALVQGAFSQLPH